jgi:hypothetical protein
MPLAPPRCQPRLCTSPAGFGLGTAPLGLHQHGDQTLGLGV